MLHNWENYFDISSEYWQKVQRIYNESEHFPKIVVKERNLHHKFPRSFSKKDGVEIDNDLDNLVSLSLSDHFLVHYYLWKCANKGYRGMMALAFSFMRKKMVKYASEETIEQLAKDYEAVMKDVSKMHSIVGKRVTSSEKWKNSMLKVNHSEVSKKANKTMKLKYSPDELRAIYKRRGNNTRGKTYEEIYGKEKAKELRETRSRSNHNRKISDMTKKKIATANKGKRCSEETKKKMSEIHKGRHWYNNGEISIMCFECPEGFVPGRIRQ